MEIVEIWECEVEEMLKKDVEMKKVFEQLPSKGPIDPRDAFFGGRTGPLALYFKKHNDICIGAADIVSLYPAVNFDTPYPVGMPQVIVPDVQNVYWTCPADLIYKGLYKVKKFFLFLQLFLGACFAARKAIFTGASFQSR